MKTDLEHLASVIESLLFVAEEPLSLRKLSNLLEVDTPAIKQAVSSLEDTYSNPLRGLFLDTVSGGIELRTKPENREWVLKMNEAKPERLSRAALETLAILAYKQPITRHDIEKVRGVDCGGVLKKLLEKNLVRILGKRDEPGNPLIYGTTDFFLQFFSISSLTELPSLREYAELQEAQGALPLDEELKSGIEATLTQLEKNTALADSVESTESTLAAQQNENRSVGNESEAQPSEAPPQTA